MKVVCSLKLTAATILLLSTPLLPQNSRPANKASFEVASVKPSAPGAASTGISSRGDRFILSGVTLRTMLVYAYSGYMRLLEDQIIGGPNWIDSDRFDIEGKADCSAGPIPAELLIQSLLEERFRLKAHVEARDLPLFYLVVGKDGVKIKPSQDQTPPATTPTSRPPLCSSSPGITTATQRGAPPDPNRPLPRGFVRMSSSPAGRTVTNVATPISAEAFGAANLTYLMQIEMGRTVVDRTGLKGLFDFTLQYSPNIAAASPAAPQTPAGTAAAPESFPSLTTALQEQLGLRLEAARGPVNVLVIESVYKPTEN